MSENWDAAVDDVLKTPAPTPDPKVALKLSIGDAIDSKPDYEAELRRAAANTGVPIGTARNDPKPVLAQHKTLNLGLDGLVETNPATAGFLANPDNAKIAHDDVDVLASVEQTLKNLGNLGKASFFSAVAGGAGYLQAMAPTMRSLGITNPIGGEFDDPKSPMGQALEVMRKGSAKLTEKYRPQTDNPWASGVNSGIINLAQFAPITAAAVLTKNPAIALGGMGALSGGQAFGEAKDAGKSDDTARTYAGVQGAIAVLSQAIPLGQLLGDVDKGTGFAQTLTKNILREAPAMQVQTLASDFARWVAINPDKPVSTFLKERGPAAIDALMTGVVGSAANTGAAHLAAHVTGQLGGLAATDGENGGKAVQAQQAAVILQQLTDVAKASKLRERDPATFHDFIAQATADGPVEHLYIDPRHIADVLAQGDPEKLTGDALMMQAMPSVLPQMDEALRTGQDIKIPTSEFATYAAGSEFAQELLPHLKTDPTAMSLHESEVFLQTHAEELKASVGKIMKDAELEDADQVSAAKVKDAVLAQLTEANRFTPDVNDAYAHLTAAFYATQAKRLGITPEEMLAQHPVKIAAQDVTGGEMLDQPESSAPRPDYADTPAFKAWFGNSTTDDGNGTPQVYFHGTRSEFDAFGRVDGGNAYGKGFYFTDDPQVASNYATGEYVNRITLPGDAHPNVVPAYLKIERPLDISQHGPNAPLMTKAEVDELADADNALRPGTWAKNELWNAFSHTDGGYRPTKSNVYQWLGEQGADQNAVIRKAGYDGLHTDLGTVVFDPKQIKSIFNGGDFDPANPDLLAQGEKNPRGSFDPNTNLISLLKGADLSTYLHESGHFYLETLARIAASNPDNAEINADMATALKFMGQKGTAAEWLAQPLDARREGHELFARGFEAYLMEGKAPSAELRGVFQRFRSWLATVYKSITGLRVSLTDDVRGVFDRMLASQQEIENHEAAQSFAPLFDTAKAAGMNPQEFEAYQRLGADATATAVDQLETRSIRDMRWLTGAKDRAVRELQKEGAAKRKAVTAEVTKEVMAEPVNRARQLLKFGLLDGQEVEGVTKLSLPDLKEMYGEAGSALDEAVGKGTLAVDYRKLGYGKYGMLAEEGLHPDHVAELVGFSSGDELVRTLLSAEDAKVTIEGKTDQRMLERYGDVADPDTIDRAADEAVHNDARLRFVATEANALAKAVGHTRVLAEAARSFAADMIGRVKVRDLQPSRYQTAENRAAKAAAKAAAKGDLVAAATEKRTQVVNGYATKAAYDAQAEVAKALRYFAKFDSAGTRKALDPEYRDQIDSLLERFDLSKGTTLKAIDKRKSLLAWYERMKAQDQEPLIPEELLNDAYRKSFKDMTMDELRGLRDTVAQIAHLARLKNRLLSAKNARDFADTIEATTQEVEASAIGKPRDLTESNQIADKVEAGARGFAVMHRKFDSLITRLAGFVDKRDPGNASTLWAVLVRPKNEAADREASRVIESTKELQRIFKALANDRVRQKVFIPEINNSLSLEGRLAVVLNWGNEGNRQRVVDGDHWTPDQVAAIFKTLEPRHFAFAQELLDHINSFKGEVAAAHKRRYGIEPPMVEPSPFQAVASDGSTVDMRGGYYPIKYDPNRSAKAADFDMMKEAKKAIVGSTRGYVKAGFMKEREDTVENRPVSKSFSAAFQHVNEVIHDLSWGDYLIDAKRLLNNDTLGNSIRVHAGPEILTSLKRAVQAMEVGDIPAQNAFEKAVQYVNAGTTLAGLGWNFIVSTKHPLGLFNGAARIGPKWIGVGLKRWVGDATSMQNTVEWVHSKSEFMANRANGRLVTRDLQDVSGKLTTGLTADVAKIVAGPKAANALHAASTAVEHSFYWMIERGQMIADIPTWIGQYEKSMEAHGDDAKAVQQANQAVRDSQTTGGLADLPEIQRGGPLMKLWTKFYSYFTVVYNQLAESAEETRFRGVSNIPALAGDVMLALILPAVSAAAIQRLLPGGDQREDWAKYLGEHLMGDLFGTMIGVRDIYAAFTEDKDAPGGMRLLKNTADLGKQVELGNFDSPAFWKALNAEGGVMFHYPSATVQRFVTGMQAMADGQTHNPLVVLTGPHPKPKP